MVRLKNSDIKQILLDFEVTDDKVSDSINNLKVSHPKGFKLYEFDFAKKSWAIIFDDLAEDDPGKVIDKLTWENQAEIIKNPKVKEGFGYPFEQKTCYLIHKKPLKKRLDQQVSGRNPGLTRSRVQNLIKEGRVKVNGEVVKLPGVLVSNSVDIELDYQTDVVKVPVEIEILYEDSEIMAVNKPSGILTHAIDGKDFEFTISDFVKQRVKSESSDLRFGIAHRLDRDTSGVLLCGKNEIAVDNLKKQFKARTIDKTYYAVTRGKIKIPEAIVDLPIARSIKHPSRFQVDPNGRKSKTHYKVIESNKLYNLVKLMPSTGRTHQLRVHLAYLNSPILGDRLYAGSKADRLMLHASEIRFTNLSGQKVIVQAELPEVFFKWTK